MITVNSMLTFFSGVIVGMVAALLLLGHKIGQLKDAIFWLGRPHSIWHDGPASMRPR